MSLSIPVAFWPSPPTHEITFLTSTRDLQRVVSGCRSGEIFIWAMDDARENDGVSLEPKVMLTGHGGAIQSIALTSFESEWADALVSVCEKHMMIVWDVTDGRGLHYADSPLHEGTASLTALPDRRFVALTGDSAVIKVIDVWNLRTVYSLRGHSEWVSSLYVCPLLADNGGIVMVSAGRDEMLSFWSFHCSAGNEGDPKEVVPVKKQPLGESTRSNPLVSLVVSIELHRILLVYQSHCEVHEWNYHDHTMNPTSIVKYGLDDGAKDKYAGGAFHSGNLITLWTSTGQINMYRTSQEPEADPPESQFGTTVSLSKSGHPHPWISYDMEKFLIGGSGKIQVYRPLGSNGSQCSLQILATGNVADGWDGVSLQNGSIISSSTVTIEHGWPTNLVNGYENGRIELEPLPANGHRVGVQGHDGAVTQLLSPLNNDSTSSRHLVLSGCTDGIVRVWSLDYKMRPPLVTPKKSPPHSPLSPSIPRHSEPHQSVGDDEISQSNDTKDTLPPLEFPQPTITLVHSFHMHTSKVLELFDCPRSTYEKHLRNCVCSIGEDNSLVIYNIGIMQVVRVFPSHPSPISGIHWSIAEDLLFVDCLSGSIAVWQLSTGELDRRIRSEQASDIRKRLQLSDHHMDYTPIPYKPKQKRRPVDVTAIQAGDRGDSRVQVLLLNIKRLIAEVKTLRSEAHQQKEKSNGNQPPTPTTPTAAATKPKSLISDTPATPNSPELVRSSTLTEITRMQLERIGTMFPAAALAYLHSWGMDEENDKRCREHMFLSDPGKGVVLGLKGVNGCMSFLTPVISRGGRRWQTSPYLTGIYSLAVVALCKSLMSLSNRQAFCSRLIMYYVIDQPDSLQNYVHSSLATLALFWQDYWDDLEQASRSIFERTLERMEESRRKTLANRWANRFLHRANENDSIPVEVSALVLGIIGSQYPDLIDSDLAPRVGEALIGMIKNGGPRSGIAAELIGNEWVYWKPYIMKDNDASPRDKMMEQMLMHTLPTSNLSKSTQHAMHNALLTIGSHEPNHFVEVMGLQTLRTDLKDSERSGAITAICDLMKKYPVKLFPHLPAVAENIIRCLDPSAPDLREECLQASTAAIRQMTRKFPMVSFHQDSQRLAIGTHYAAILIYDLRTSTLWRVFDGHYDAIDAVKFSPNGEMIASFSQPDQTVRIWQAYGGFLNMLGLQGRCLHVYHLNFPEKMTSAKLLNVRLEWTCANTVALLYNDKTIQFFNA